MKNSGIAGCNSGRTARSWAVGAIIALGLATLLGWVYAPVLTANYGWNDDFHLLKRIGDGSFNVRHSEYLEGGRPLLGWGTAWLFSIPNSIDTLKEARLVSVAGIMIFALTALTILRLNGFGRAFSITVSLLMCLTPGFAVYAGWLTEGLDTFAAAAALAAGNLLGLAVEDPGHPRRRLHFCLGVALLLAAYLTYQPVAAFGTIALLIRAWRGFRLDWQRARDFAIAFGILMAVAAFYFIAYKLACRVFHLGGQTERAGFVKDPLAQIRFVGKVLWSGTASWSLFYQQGIQCLTVLFVVGLMLYGCLAKSSKKLTAPLLGLVCTTLTLLITILPHMLLSERTFAFRTQTALHAVVGLAFVVGLERLISLSLPPAATKWGRHIAFVGVICLASYQTHHHLKQDFVAPSARELAVLTKGLETFKEFPARMAFIVPGQWVENSEDIAEFRSPSSPLPWSSAAMLELILIQIFEKNVPLRAALRQRSTFGVEYGPTTNAVPQLDGFKLVDGDSALIPHDPYWGAIRTNQYWCVSDWFGVFNNRWFPSIYHSQLGWLQCAGKGGDDFWFYSDKFGWFWTSPKSFPALYFRDRDTWFQLSRSLTPSCSFYDYKRQVWTGSTKP